jgi:P-type Cu+ transporter
VAQSGVRPRSGTRARQHNEGTARAVAERLGIGEYREGLLPDGKAQVVRELEVSGERVAFVGDGVNDAPRWPPPPSGWRWAQRARTWLSKPPTLR